MVDSYVSFFLAPAFEGACLTAYYKPYLVRPGEEPESNSVHVRLMP